MLSKVAILVVFSAIFGIVAGQHNDVNSTEGVLVFEYPLTGPNVSRPHDQHWDGDLGIPFIYNNDYWFLEGDISNQQPQFMRLGNSIGYCHEIHNCSVKWNPYPGHPRFPEPFFPIVARTSTVPAGAIELNGVAYIYMFNVTTFHDGLPGNVEANSFLIQGTPPVDDTPAVPFTETTVRYARNDKFVNIAPMLSPQDGYVYLYGSGKYRVGNISLARVMPDQITNQSAYMYFKYNKKGEPTWVADLAGAEEIVVGGIGELSAQYNNYLQKYMISYFDFKLDGSGVLRLGYSTSGHPWGPFNVSTLLFNSAVNYYWEEPTWGAPYGGFMAPERDAVPKRELHLAISLFFPYRVFILKYDLNKLGLPTFPAASTTGLATPRGVCDSMTFSGSQGYFCDAQNTGFYQCESGVFASQDSHMACPAGTTCGCPFGQECSCGGTRSPCVTAGTNQQC